MMLALNTLMWHAEPFENVIAYARDLGILSLDLGAIPGVGHLRLTPDDVEAPCAAFRAKLPTDLRVVALTADHNDLSSPDPVARAGAVDYTVAAMQAAALLGAPVVGTSLGSIGPGRDWREAADCAIDSLSRIMPSSPPNVRLAVEIHVNDVCNSLKKAEAILAAVAHDRLGVAFDTSLLFHNSIDIDDAFDRLGDRLFHAHLRGATGETYFAIPGRDEVDFAHFLRRLSESNYDGALSLELYEVEQRYGITTLAACRESLAYLRRTTDIPGGP
jgi:sugar phosphate isomerase/epimerase